MAANDLTTLASVKTYLNIPSSSNGDDALLGTLITAASSLIQGYTGRDLVSTAYSERYNGTGTAKMFLRNYPIISVTSLSIYELNIPQAPDSNSSGFLFDDKRLYLTGNPINVLNFNSSGFSIFTMFSVGVQNVKVVYQAGYATIPLDLQQGCNELVALRYRERTRLGERSKSMLGESISYDVAQLTDSIKRWLQPYRRMAPV